MTLAAIATESPAESRTGHSRLLKCALVVEESRDYWRHIEEFRANSSEIRTDNQAAFQEYWFGARSEKWVKEIMLNMRARYEAYPMALEGLSGWTSMLPQDRHVICHWHCQLADMHYRRFTGEYLVDRREALKPELYRQSVINWVTENVSDSWTMVTRTRMAGQLLSTAYAAGLVTKKRDPRPLAYPSVSAEALTYLLYLLRDIDIDGTQLDNPYLRSVGLSERLLSDRIGRLSAVTYQSKGGIQTLEWRYPSLVTWAQNSLEGSWR